MGKKKNFVLDTNVILHDFSCIEHFEENDIYLPIIVLEELDKFKKGNEQINFNAREFARKLDKITDNDLFTKGASLGKDKGRFYVYINNVYEEQVAHAFPSRIPDHQIISATISIAKEHPEEKTILVTKDINMRMKARSLGLLVEDYSSDKVVNTDFLEKEQRTIDNVDSAIIDNIYSSNDGIDKDELPFKDIKPNECFILKSDRNSALVRYNPFTNRVAKINKKSYFGIQPRNAEQAFALEILADPDIKLIALTGKAGTGKTLLALAAALEQFQDYQQILLARPIVSLANKDLGFLPGDEKSKVRPYMQPLFDNLNVIKSQFKDGSNVQQEIDKMLKEQKLVIEALAFIRGRSLSDTIFIVDEAQNLTPHEVKTIITRAGDNTKFIFTGDIQQIDSPYLDAKSNGLSYMIDKMDGQKIFAHINLLKGERSELSELASNLL